MAKKAREMQLSSSRTIRFNCVIDIKPYFEIKLKIKPNIRPKSHIGFGNCGGARLLLPCVLAAFVLAALAVPGCGHRAAQPAHGVATPAAPAPEQLPLRTSGVKFSAGHGGMSAKQSNPALTLDIFRPFGKTNRAAVIWLVSGGWYSSRAAIDVKLSHDVVEALRRRGYTVFAVVHRSQPEYSIPEILPDIERAVRFVRHHAPEYGVAPERIGLVGASSGGHLALMQALNGAPGNAAAGDAVERASSQVQAVACFFPPTDFLNYGKNGVTALGHGRLRGFAAAFDFPGGTSPARKRETGHRISPANWVSADDPPVLLIHGDKDELVPLQQSVLLAARLRQMGVPQQLIVRRGAGHKWEGFERSLLDVAAWMDKYLLGASNGSP